MRIWRRDQMWQAAALILYESESSAQAVGLEENRQKSRYVTSDLLDWAIDFINCAGDKKMLLARYYLRDKRRSPRFRATVYRFWQEVRRKGLDEYAEKKVLPKILA